MDLKMCLKMILKYRFLINRLYNRVIYRLLVQKSKVFLSSLIKYKNSLKVTPLFS